MIRPPASEIFEIATAGHVNHGKSTLVRRLTGTDPDRFAEEKRRGLTIDLGFASMVLPSGREVGFVDVPGHKKFVNNMLAGVGAIKACVFVVSAKDGWAVQSEEHLNILELLGIERGIVVLTRTDEVDSCQLDERENKLSMRLAGTFLGDTGIIRMDPQKSCTELINRIEGMLDRIPPASDRRRPRMWIDRSFVVRGAGKVVTGLLTDGCVQVGDLLEVVPSLSPDQRVDQVRVRSIEIHGRTVESAPPGVRAALALSGRLEALRRGQAICALERWELADVFDADFHVASNVKHRIGKRGAYTIHFGTYHSAVTVRPLGVNFIEPGSNGMVRMTVPRRLPVVWGDRFIVREQGRNVTVGGGTIIDASPVLPPARARPDYSLDRIIRERGYISVSEFERLTACTRPATVGSWLIDPAAHDKMQGDLERRLTDPSVAGIRVASLEGPHIDVLMALPGIRIHRGRAMASRAQLDPRGLDVVRRLEEDPFQPADLDIPASEKFVLDVLSAQGAVVCSNGIWFARSAIEKAAQFAVECSRSSPSGFSVSSFRNALGSTRKFSLALLAYLDNVGLTVLRNGVRTVATSGVGDEVDLLYESLGLERPNE